MGLYNFQLQIIETLNFIPSFWADVKAFHATARKYMIRGHRQFIEDLWKYVHLRDFGNWLLPSHNLFHSVKESASEELLKAYNSCVKEVLNFRMSAMKILKMFVGIFVKFIFT